MPAVKILLVSLPTRPLAFPAKRVYSFAGLQGIPNPPPLSLFNFIQTSFHRNKPVYCNGDRKSAQSSVVVDTVGAVFLLFREMGLSQEETELVLAGNPDVESSSFETIRSRVYSLQSLGLNDLLLASLVLRHPHVLTGGDIDSMICFIHDDLENKLRPAQVVRLLAKTEQGFFASFMAKISMLLKHGIPQVQISSILNQINLNKAMAYKTVEEIDRMLTFLSHHGGVGIVMKRPKILNCDLDVQLAPRVGFLKKLSGGDNEATAAVIRRQPGVILYSKEHMEGQVEFMRSFAGLTDEEIFRIILTYPNLMSVSRERKLKPRIKFLKDCGFDSRDIYRFSTQSPLFLGLSFKGNLAFKLAMLVKIGYEYRTKDLAVAVGAVTRTSIENLQEVIELYLSYGLSFEDVITMSKKHPQILQYNPRSLEKKMEFLVEVMGRDVGELLAFPAYLSYNLDKRIKPRYDAKKNIVGEQMSINKLLSVSVERFTKMTKRYEENNSEGQICNNT